MSDYEVSNEYEEIRNMSDGVQDDTKIYYQRNGRLMKYISQDSRNRSKVSKIALFRYLYE